MYLQRGLEDRLESAVAALPLVILEGARATGKTELVGHAIERGWLSGMRSFLDPVELLAATAAPRDYVFGLPHGTAIDEAQLCEQILLPVKERIEHAGPGALLLTGSTRLRRDELGGSDPLAGRVGRPLHLGPLTIAERGGEPKQLVERLFEDDPLSIEMGRPLSRTDLIALVQQPGLPGLFAGAAEAQGELARAYIAQATTQSSFESVDIQRVNQLGRYLAGRTSTMVNVSEYGKAVELNRSSVDKYLSRLEEALLIVRLPGWRRSKDKSETDRAKLHFFDAGIAAATARMLPGIQDDDLGRLAETLLVTDLVRQAHWLKNPPSCYHWRRSDRDEVDLVLEWSDGRAICVEAKVAESVETRDFRGIDEFRRRHPEAFHRGFVFYSGRNVQSFGNERWAIPFGALSAAASESRTAPVHTFLKGTRESTWELWERVLPRLIEMTAADAVAWDDVEEGMYVAMTAAGNIRISRRWGPGLPAVGGRLASLAGSDLAGQASLTMFGANGQLVSELEVSENEVVQQGSLSWVDGDLSEARNERLGKIHELAVELLTLIERTPTAASGVADNILDALRPD